jgi:Ca-activated chloride channel homolog
VAPLRAARLCAWLAVAAVVVAAAEPSIRTAPRQRVGILELVVDRSGSTEAGDVAPTRLGAIRQATLALLDRVPERVRVGLVAFSDEAVTLARPSTDRDAVRAGLASMRPGGGTAAGDALRRALDDIQAASPAAPAAVLLLSDGASSTGSDPFDAAREAAARHVPVFAVAIGTPDGVLIRRDFDGVRQQPVPPDPALLRGIAGPTGGRALEARSLPALHAALEDLGRDAGVAGGSREVTLLFAAAALLLLAVGSALSPRRRSPAGARTAPRAVTRRLAPSVALLLAAGGAAVAWTQVPPSLPAPGPALAGAAAVPASPSRPPSPPAFVTVTAVSGRDRTMVRQAVAVLRRHRELADQRRVEIDRLGYERIAELRVTVCDVCTAEPLTSTPMVRTTSAGGVVCSPNLNTPILRRMARRAHVPATSLAAMLIHYEQELCLIGPNSDRSPFPAELRLARKLRDGRLFDLLFAQIDTGPATDWLTVEQGSPSCAGTASSAPSGGRSSAGGGSTRSGPSRSRCAAAASPIASCWATRPPARWPTAPSSATSASTWPWSRARPAAGACPSPWSSPPCSPTSRSTASAIPMTARPPRSTRSGAWRARSAARDCSSTSSAATAGWTAPGTGRADAWTVSSGGSRSLNCPRQGGPMLWLVLVVALVLLLFGALGDAAQILLWIGLILLVLWLLGWVIRPGTPRRRWYYW